MVLVSRTHSVVVRLRKMSANPSAITRDLCNSGNPALRKSLSSVL
jgi:hypothetical protein